MAVVVAAASPDLMGLHALLSKTKTAALLVPGDPATVGYEMATQQFGSGKSVPIACPDPTPDDHHCLKPLPCPRCKNSTSMDESGPPPTPHQIHVGHLESGNVGAPVSHPEPPHVCKEIPCPFCGRRAPYVNDFPAMDR